MLKTRDGMTVVPASPAQAPDTLEPLAGSWRLIVYSLKRPYPVSVPMIVFASLVPLYVFIASAVRDRVVHAPALPLDGTIPLWPAWTHVYGPLYLFLLALPVFVVRHETHIRHTVFAYLMVWLIAYASFLLYPTIAPRPPQLIGDTFSLWGLRVLYDIDPPYNCFPSIHVAHSFISAFACHRVHRQVGVAATIAASLVAVSTLFTKQHYVLDVIGGVGLAALAYGIFLRTSSREVVSALDRRLAPMFALGLAGVIGGVIVCAWLFYEFLRPTL